MEITIKAKNINEAINKLMLHIATEIETTSNELLIEHGNVDTGELLNSSRIETQPNEVILSWDAEHTTSIEYGSDPHYPDFEKIKKWCQRKLQMTEKEATSFAYYICNKIAKHGQEPKPFIMPSIIKVLNKFK